jgi:hypothetical protein
MLASVRPSMQSAFLHRRPCLLASYLEQFTNHSCSLVSFSQLQKQIIDLATTHFVHLPVRPPAEDLAQVPSNLPSFLGDTVASRYVLLTPRHVSLLIWDTLDKCGLPISPTLSRNSSRTASSGPSCSAWAVATTRLIRYSSR